MEWWRGEKREARRRELEGRGEMKEKKAGRKNREIKNSAIEKNRGRKTEEKEEAIARGRNLCTHARFCSVVFSPYFAIQTSV